MAHRPIPPVPDAVRALVERAKYGDVDPAAFDALDDHDLLRAIALFAGPNFGHLRDAGRGVLDARLTGRSVGAMQALGEKVARLDDTVAKNAHEANVLGRRLVWLSIIMAVAAVVQAAVAIALLRR